MIEVGDLVRLSPLLRLRCPWLTSLWIVIELQNTFDANGEVTIAFLHNGLQKYTQRTTLLEKL